MAETLTITPVELPDDLENVIGFDDEAQRRARRLLDRKHPGNPEMGFRMGVRGGGCSGLSYVFDFDEKVSKWDHVFDIGGIKVIVDKKSLLYLKGTTVRWSGNLMEGGFIFDNPNASKSCGCGTSFTID
jgi:iron-sulfur cluster assembly protein